MAEGKRSFSYKIVYNQSVQALFNEARIVLMCSASQAIHDLASTYAIHD